MANLWMWYSGKQSWFTTCPGFNSRNLQTFLKENLPFKNLFNGSGIIKIKEDKTRLLKQA